VRPDGTRCRIACAVGIVPSCPDSYRGFGSFLIKQKKNKKKNSNRDIPPHQQILRPHSLSTLLLRMTKTAAGGRKRTPPQAEKDDNVAVS